MDNIIITDLAQLERALTDVVRMGQHNDVFKAGQQDIIDLIKYFCIPLQQELEKAYDEGFWHSYGKLGTLTKQEFIASYKPPFKPKNKN